MATQTRDRMVEAMQDLLTRRGLAASGLNELVATSGSPKGSIYHYFPGGKEQIAAEALRRSGQQAAAATGQAFEHHRDSPAAALRAVMDWLATTLAASDYRYGCSIATTALEAASESEPIRLACEDAYATWLSSISHGLATSGIDPGVAERLAVVTLAAIEGALVLSRVQRSTAPLGHVAEAVTTLVEQAPPLPPTSERTPT